QCLSKFEITQRPISFFDLPPPRTEMHFVNANRTSWPLPPALFHPIRITPAVALQIVHKRRCRRPMLIEKREWIALKQKHAGLRADFKFVICPFPAAR